VYRRCAGLGKNDAVKGPPTPGKTENSVEASDVEFALLNARLVHELNGACAGAKILRSSLGQTCMDRAER
jgi:hypothetical protein